MYVYTFIAEIIIPGRNTIFEKNGRIVSHNDDWDSAVKSYKTGISHVEKLNFLEEQYMKVNFHNLSKYFDADAMEEFDLEQ